ncbi:hypothetical protein BO78DRAFT_415582 [Aspergillus sclerotiicarbonarius CBS 121057]|uniref:Mid2 domain-containing protein n=1 Tax=Aspergillus sclerotiicarbonarius (strain CBS 121057 / IBT 28362) TaxID=1448318 RepID=A0A319EXW2_ASPSB|nr:hypothetical protein BO78DRAFT_415582 [Aspergillus sclerotiicarbonarius CBS 121057]
MTTSTTSPLPLTTTFTPPASCLSDIWAVNSTGLIWMNLGPTDTAECLPSGWGPSTYFSPGLCPSGYIIAKTIEYIGSNTTETAATCCPIAGSTNTYSIRNSATTGEPWFSTEVCAWQPSPNVVTLYEFSLTTTDGSTTSATGSMTSPGSINAYGVEVRWQSTDFVAPTGTATASVTGTTESVPAGSSQTQTASSSSGLATGAKVGIGVGVAIAGVLVIALVAWGLLRRRRRNHQRMEAMRTSNGPNGGDGVVYSPLAELPTKTVKAELPADATPAELDG